MKNQKRSRRPVGPLPDDVVMQILSRLPAHDVLKFRRVCRRWRDLISTQYFAEMHVKAKAYSSPMIVVQDRMGYNNRDQLLLLDKWEAPRKRTRIRKIRLNFTPFSSYLYKFSYDGLIVVNGNNSIRKSTDFIIFNPISGDKVTISRPNPNYYGSMSFELYGMFFNPPIREYCILWRSLELGDDAQFRLLNLGAQPCCRALKQPASFMHKPRGGEPPVVVDDATLYWMVGVHYSRLNCCEFPSCEELIMAFDIKTEEFSVMPHPGPTDGCHHSKHVNMHILKMDGLLSFVQSTITTNSFIINIWTLKDSATRLWRKTHSVSINVDQFNIDVGGLRAGNFKVMAVGNGELLLRYSKKTVYACHLELGTVRRIGKTYIYSIMSTYVPSFASLRNCESEIWIS